jgi:SAM-dependent methyltransferase
MCHNSNANVNRSWWNERAAVHGQDEFYDTRGFFAGQSTLYQLDRDTVGDVTGLDLIHLQCHTGMDTMSWLRAGARTVTGIDFSDVAVAKAIATAEAAGLSKRATFIEADVLAVPELLHGRFDVCYASRGVISWIGDMAAWMRTAASVLRAGGRLALIDSHPLFIMATSVDPLRLDFPYINDGPRRFDDQGGSYADPDAVTEHNATIEYGHSLGEIVTAAIEAGLVIERLGEHVTVESDTGRGLLSRDEDGLMRWRYDGELLPIIFSLRAAKTR